MYQPTLEGISNGGIDITNPEMFKNFNLLICFLYSSTDGIPYDGYDTGNSTHQRQ